MVVTWCFAGDAVRQGGVSRTTVAVAKQLISTGNDNLMNAVMQRRISNRFALALSTLHFGLESALRFIELSLHVTRGGCDRGTFRVCLIDATIEPESVDSQHKCLARAVSSGSRNSNFGGVKRSTDVTTEWGIVDVKKTPSPTLRVHL